MKDEQLEAERDDLLQQRGEFMAMRAVLRAGERRCPSDAKRLASLRSKKLPAGTMDGDIGIALARIEARLAQIEDQRQWP